MAPRSQQTRRSRRGGDGASTRGGRGYGASGPTPPPARGRCLRRGRSLVPPRGPSFLSACCLRADVSAVSPASRQAGPPWRTPGRRSGGWRPTSSGRSSPRPRRGARPSLSSLGSEVAPGRPRHDRRLRSPAWTPGLPGLSLLPELGLWVRGPLSAGKPATCCAPEHPSVPRRWRRRRLPAPLSILRVIRPLASGPLMHCLFENELQWGGLPQNAVDCKHFALFLH